MKLSLPKTATFSATPLASRADRVAGRVLAIASDGTVIASGSCVRIGSGLYLTAKHVIEDFVDSFGHTHNHLNVSIWIVHLYDGPTMEIWDLTNAWTPTNTDIAVLRAVPYSDNITRMNYVNTVRMELAPPPVGSRITAYGFHSSNGTFNVDDEEVRLDIWGQPATSVGEIREIHRQKRDLVTLNFPCFRVNARFDGGMSGGPIFSDSGGLCGVICNGYALNQDEPEAISYGSTLWPVLCIPITIDVQTGKECEPYCLIELTKKDLIHVTNAHLLDASITNGVFNGIYNQPQ